MSTVITLITVAAIIGLSLSKYIKMSKNGGCGCGCADCPSKNKCKSSETE